MVAKYDFLQSMGDDIHQIEWQNRGLQVQTANQRSLVTELQELLVSYILIR